MLLFLESFGFIIALAIMAFIGIFILARYPLPPDTRAGNLWQLAAQYEHHFPGAKGKFIKHFMRLTVLAGGFFAIALFILRLSRQG
jgi:hypothetical protein